LNLSERKEVRTVFQYPLLEAIAKRRSRRIPLGYKLESGMIKKDPVQTPIPLSNIEEAILCWSGAGITGTVTHEGTTGAPVARPVTSWAGRATGYPCNIQTTRLFFTNDKGVFLYNPTKPSKTVEIENESDRDKIMTMFENDCRKVMDGRLKLFSPDMIDVEAMNNQSGTTVFIPIVDNVELYIWRVFFSLQPFMSYQFFDDMKKRPAGLQKWVDSGKLKGPPVGLASFEHNQRTIYLAPAYLMVQNMQLVAEAMGLGSVPFAGYTGDVMLGVTSMGKGLGFRSEKDKEGNLNPVGLDGFFESYCPPYYRSIDDAVDAFIEKIGGLTSPIGPEYIGVLPYESDYWKKNRPKYVRPSEDHVNMVKAFCNYVYDTYGKIPATFSSKTIPIWLQVHHIDTKFYGENFAKGIISDAHKNHMDMWHSHKA
jgi:hypothetical protein